ncbi:MAG: thiol oxidoreductase [Ignavibacteriales bacterium]|nr:thiol oxidoreductase [Ignavibacteriales bacterium]
MKTLLTIVAVSLLFSLVLLACDAILTTPIAEGESFDAPLPGLSHSQLAAFARGDEAFGKVFSVKEGLGPLFNQPSCETCHPGDGRGSPRTNLIRFGYWNGVSFDPLISLGGPQLQERGIPGVPGEKLPPEANAISPRSPPPVFGLGLIEAIPDSAILANADENDLDGDGISGRPNWVTAPEYIGRGPGPHLGRFGRKAGVAFLLQQVVTAYQQDIGITTDYLPVENEHPQAGIPVRDDVPDPELAASVVNDVVFYLRTLAPPARGAETPEVLQGKQLFSAIGCAGCHVPSFTTGPSAITALNNVEVTLYSDLLLHDMGPELADNFYEGSSTGTEWRTAPLWGLRLVKEFLGGSAFYLNDGRTSDLREAIRLHGGEAQSARGKFLQLSESEKLALIKFLESL